MLGVVSAVIVELWPKSWEPAQQASLAGALIALVGGIFAVVGKWFFDRISINTQHVLSVRENIIGRFYKYAGNYLAPLAGTAGELNKYLAEFRIAQDAVHTQMEQDALHATLFYLSKYIQLQYVLRGQITLPNIDPPEGIFLVSPESEELVWALMIPPWAFGIETLEQQSLLVQELTKHSQVEFINLCQDQSSDLHGLGQHVDAALKEDWPNKISDLSDTLHAFNLILAYELTMVYSPWYRKSAPYPRHALATVLDLPEDRRDRIGIFYGYPIEFAEKLANSGGWARWFKKGHK